MLRAKATWHRTHLAALPLNCEFGAFCLRSSLVSAFFLCACIANAQNNFVTGQAARAEIGQQNFTSGQSGAAANLLGSANGIAYDPVHGLIWVADSNLLQLTPQNNRVLSFPTNQIPGPYVDLSQQTPADSNCGLCGFGANTVLGQPDFVSSNPGRAATATAATGSVAETGSMSGPTAVATDGTYLVVADTNNNRVLIWNTVPTSTNTAPNLVLGQTSFTSLQTPPPSTGSGLSGLTASTITGPQGVWIQNGALFVADTYDDRVLVWRHIPTQNNQPADLVLGQSGFTTSYAPPPVANNATFPPTTASLLLNPTSVTSDGTRLYIADLGNNRVLIWNAAFVNGNLNLSNDQAADVVVGQPLLTTSVPNWSGALCGAADNTAPCAASLDFPRFALSDGTRLFIADGGNDRVLIYNTIPTQNGTSANEVLGQVNFVTDQVTSNSIDITSTSIDNTSAVDIIPTPTSLAFDGTNLYVADPINRRVLQFTAGDTQLPDGSAVNWASEIIRQEGIVTVSVPSGGAITANDTVTVTIQGTDYTYTIVKNDTLDTITQGLVNVIDNSNSGAGDPNATALFGGTGTGNVYLASKGINLAYDSISLAATTSNAADITATASGSYLSAGNAGTGAAGMLVEIDGSNLSDVTMSAPLTGQLPTNLGGVEVFMDGLASPILSVSPTQIITEIPFTYVNGSDINAGTVGTSAFTDRNSTSIYVLTQHSGASATVTNATPMYIAPANPGLFNAPTVSGQPRPWPVINAYHQSGNATSVVSVDGSVTAGNTVSITVASTTYTYTVQSTDTLLTVAGGLTNLINGAPDPYVFASLGAAFARVIITARQPGAAGVGIPISATSNASATETLTAYTGSTCCNVAPGTLITPTNPAVPGELISVSAAGLGTVQSIFGGLLPVTTGQPYSGPVLNSAVSSVTATINGQTAEVIGAGLVEGGYGMYNIQMVVPSGLPTNTTTQIYVAQNAFISNTATIPVGPPGVAAVPTGPPGAGLSSASLLFSPTTLVLNAAAGSPSQTGTVNVSNPNNVQLTFSGMSVTGTNAADFSYTTTCQGTVSQSCAITVTFTPSTSAMEAATLVISDNVDNSTQIVQLIGVSGAVYEIANELSGRVLDVTNASTADGAPIQEYDYLGGNNQKWSFVPVSGGAYVIMNLNSGKVLDMTNLSTQNGGLLQQWDNTGGKNQQWILTPLANGFYKITNVNSGLVLDDTAGAIQNGTVVQQWQFLDNANQHWSLIPTQTYSIYNLETGKVLDVTNLSTQNGALIQEWDLLGNPNQRWQFIPVDSTYFTITNLGSGKVLDVINASFDDGTNIQQYEYEGGDNQKWALVPTGFEGYYSIVNKLTGRVLDVTGASGQDGTLIQQYDYEGGENQIWQLVPYASNH